MRKVVLILLALLAVRLLPRALRREAAALHLIAALTKLATTMAVANTSKTVATEQRVGTLETSVGGLHSSVNSLQSKSSYFVGAQGNYNDNDGDTPMGDISSSRTMAGLINDCNTIIHHVNNLQSDHNDLNNDAHATRTRVNQILFALDGAGILSSDSNGT